MRTPNSDAAAVPILPKRSADDDLDESWMGDFAKEKRSAEDDLDEAWMGDFAREKRRLRVSGISSGMEITL